MQAVWLTRRTHKILHTTSWLGRSVRPPQKTDRPATWGESYRRTMPTVWKLHTGNTHWHTHTISVLLLSFYPRSALRVLSNNSPGSCSHADTKHGPQIALAAIHALLLAARTSRRARVPINIPKGAEPRLAWLQIRLATGRKEAGSRARWELIGWEYCVLAVSSAAGYPLPPTPLPFSLSSSRADERLCENNNTALAWGISTASFHRNLIWSVCTLPSFTEGWVADVSLLLLSPSSVVDDQSLNKHDLDTGLLDGFFFVCFFVVVFCPTSFRIFIILRSCILFLCFLPSPFFFSPFFLFLLVFFFSFFFVFFFV